MIVRKLWLRPFTLFLVMVLLFAAMPVLVLAPVVSAQVAVWYVKPDGSDIDIGDSWEYAFATIQAAIDTASAGDEIWVECFFLAKTKKPMH